MPIRLRIGWLSFLGALPISEDAPGGKHKSLEILDFQAVWAPYNIGRSRFCLLRPVGFQMPYGFSVRGDRLRSAWSVCIAATVRRRKVPACPACFSRIEAGFNKQKTVGGGGQSGAF
jgi:hypothetical protein